jgi:hypothetical protein
MTITVEILLKWERKLRRQAKARGLTLEAFLTTIIANQAAAMDILKSTDSVGPRGEESDGAIDDLFDSVSVPPGVGEGAMRRENWYR